MKIILTDRIMSQVIETEAYLTNHHEHSRTGAVVMVFEHGRELTFTTWKLAKGRIVQASMEERHKFSKWLGQHQ